MRDLLILVAFIAAVALTVLGARMLFDEMARRQNEADADAEFPARCRFCGAGIVRKRDVRVEPHRGDYVDAHGKDTCSDGDRNHRGRFHEKV